MYICTYNYVRIGCGMTALQFSRALIHLVTEVNKSPRHLTNKKLQKLIYYCQVWSLTILKQRLFRDEFEAWVHGPVVPTVYRSFKEYKFMPIPPEEGDGKLFLKLSPEQRSVVEEVVRLYEKHDADYLEMLTHNEPPWINARHGIPDSGKSNKRIDIESAPSYYSKFLRN